METAPSFLDDPADTREEIMRATYFALCEHGYANLTVQRIAAFFPKSKSHIYNHYGSKDELLLAFLEDLLGRFEESLPREEHETATAQLRAVLDHVFQAPLPEGRREFTKAMVELRAQAAHDDRYRDHFTRSDRFFRDHLADIVEAGVDAGEFAPVDADRTATALVTLVNGSMTQQVTSTDESASAVRTAVDDYLDRVLGVGP